MLPERSSTRTMSVGLEAMSGAAESARVTFQCTVAVNTVCTYLFIRICNTHSVSSSLIIERVDPF